MKKTAILLFLALASPALAEPTTAEALYDQGDAAYKRADYAAAIVTWKAAYELSHQEALLFNIAQAYRLAGDCPQALATYKHFVAADPTSDQRSLAEDLTGELEKACPPQAAPVPQPPLQTTTTTTVAAPPAVPRMIDQGPDRERSGRSLRIAGLVTSSTGAALLVTGLVVGHHAQALGDDVTRACAVSCDWAVQKSKESAGRRDATIGHVLDAAGVAAIAGGAAMYYFGHESSVTFTPRMREGGGVVSWSGSW